jgi:hypothetical protein
MKNLSFLFIPLIALIGFAGCAGTTKPENNTSEAFQVDLTEHSADTGDIIKNSYGLIVDTLNCYYGADSTFYEFENNGIDAYHEGNWIYLPWRHISDPATISLEIFRFSYSDYQNHNSQDIESINFIPFQSYDKDYYMDTFAGNSENVIDETWFYFIKTTNADGDTAFSDTVGYKLVNKPLLRIPADNAVYAQTDSLIFQWDINSSNSAIKHRLLLFNDNYEMIWFYNLLSDEAPLINYSELVAEHLPTGNYIWRVDAIVGIIDHLPINNNVFDIYSGSEAMERRFIIN